MFLIRKVIEQWWSFFKETVMIFPCDYFEVQDKEGDRTMVEVFEETVMMFPCCTCVFWTSSFPLILPFLWPSLFGKERGELGTLRKLGNTSGKHY